MLTSTTKKSDEVTEYLGILKYSPEKNKISQDFWEFWEAHLQDLWEIQNNYQKKGWQGQLDGSEMTK